MIGIKEAISEFMAGWHKCHYCDFMCTEANMADVCYGLCNDCLEELSEGETNA